MGLFFILLLSIGLPIFYLAMIGVTYGLLDFYDEVLQGMASIIWPLTLPIFLAHSIVRGDFEYVPRAERKHKKAVLKAKREQEIARINAETLAIQEREAGLFR